MRITFSCPTCAKSYDLPLSLAGKKARCKQCSAEFLIPAPVEAGSPRSSEAIPVTSALEPPPSPRKPPVEIPKKPVPAPAVVAPPAEDAEADDEPWPDYAMATPEAAPIPIPKPKSEPVGPIPPKPRPMARPSKSASTIEMAPRPRWFIPVVSIGSFVVVFLVNLGAYVATSSRIAPIEDQPQPIAEGNPANIGDLARNDPPPTQPITQPSPKTKSNTNAKSKAKARPEPATPSKPKPPVVAATPSREEAPDRLLSSADIAARYEASVALIKGKKGSGTGFIVKPGILATNAHVIDGERAKDLEIRFPSADKAKQGPYPAKILFQDRDRDLALLGVTTELAPVRIAEGYKFVKGEDVTVIGNPGVGGQLILENAISRGLVSSMATINEHSFIQLSISINPGNSGGPVFDARGRVIGVVTLKTTKQEGLAFAIPVEDVLSSLETAEAIVGFENDAAGPKPAEPEPKPKTNPAQPKPKADVAQARPKGDLAQPKPKADPAKPKANPGDLQGEAPTLAYAWKQGETYVYSFEQTLDLGANLFRQEGCSIYRVKAVDGEGITLTHRGWYVQTRRSKDGSVAPGSISQPTRTAQVELKIDPQGEIIRASGSSPLPLLGDFSMLLIEPLPDEPRKAWNDSKTITLNEVEQAPGSGGGVPRLGRPGVGNSAGGSLRQRIQQRRGGSRIGRMANPAPEPQAPGAQTTSHEATEETTYVLGERDGAKVPIRKLYELATKEMVGNDPRFTMSGQGTLTFDVDAGLPLALEYELKVVETSANVTFRLPVTVRCKLLEGQEKQQGLEPPVYTPTAMNKIDVDQVTKLVGDLGSTDANRRRQACQTLRESAPIEDKRPEVSRILERLCRDKDRNGRGDAVKALAIWGDDKSVEYLLGSLDNADFAFRDELFEALARLSPTEATAEAIIPWMYKDRGRAQIALQAIGEVAEGPILRYAEHGTDKTLRIMALEFLKDHGSTATIETLKRLASWRQDGEVGGMAADVAKQIRRRFPSEDEMAAILRQLRSSDAGKRREAADRFGSFPRVDAIQPDVARALERVIADSDGWAQSMAFKALAIWGDEESRQRILERMEDMDLQSYRDAIDTLVKFGPNEASVRAIGRWIKKDRRLTLDALGSMGPMAEDVAIAALKDVGQDGFLRNDLCKLLGKIGTDKSLVLLKSLGNGRDARDAQAAIATIEERAAGKQGLSLIDELRKNEARKRREALEKLADLKPTTDDGRAKVARALELLWEGADNPSDKLREATIRWGDAKTAAFLEAHLDDPDFRMREDALRALVGLRPDARTGELVVASFKKNGRFVYEIGQKIPTMVERPLLKMISSETESRWKLEPIKALGVFGTPAVLADLDQLARKAGDAEIAAHAEQALNGITSRQ